MEKRAPVSSTNIFSDLRYFLFARPLKKTLLAQDGKGARTEIEKSILQRTGVEVDDYKMLNVHKLGIEAPASYVFEELLNWNGDSICWPNHIAKVQLQDNSIKNIKIFLFGMSFRILGLDLLHLFDLKSLKIQHVPDISDHDNARYLLYECKGGYPIGVFSMYVRSSIPERGEEEMSQLFMMVSFNFYGKKKMRLRFINRIWEGVHNRTTSNIMCRFKQLCEWRFKAFTDDP